MFPTTDEIYTDMHAAFMENVGAEHVFQAQHFTLVTHVAVAMGIINGDPTAAFTTEFNTFLIDIWDCCEATGIDYNQVIDAASACSFCTCPACLVVN